VLYDRCQTFHTLPDAGGLLDQDERLMTLMMKVAEAYYTAKSGSATDPGYMDWYNFLLPNDEPREALQKIAERAAKEQGRG